MKKLFFTLLLLCAVAYSKQTDVYFANGVLTSEQEAEKNARLLKKLINRPDVPKVYTAYNHTYDLPLLPKNNGGFDFFACQHVRGQVTMTT